MTRRVGIAGIVVLLLAVTAAAESQFVPSPDAVPFGRYRVTLSPATLAEGEELVERLLLICRCRREPYAELGFHGFVVTASESMARLLSMDGRVLRVEGLAPEVPVASAPVPLPPPEPSPSAVVHPKTQAEAGRFVPVPDADATPWQTGTYGYDGSGNITNIGTDLYRYDAYGRVRRADAGGRTQTFTYDRYANLTSIATSGHPAPITLLPDAATNRLQSNGSIPAVSYDASGRLTTMKGASPTFIGLESFVYDSTDVVVESTVENVRRVHLYSASDERIATFTIVNNASAASEWTLRDPSGKVLRRLNRDAAGNWSWVEDYIYRDGQLLAAEVAGPDRTLHFHSDHLGTPRLITNHAGAKVALHTYDAFGLEVTNPNQDTERLKFTGHERDAAHVDYMHARYYTARWGRFLSVDPANFWQVRPGDKAGQAKLQDQLRKPQGWNRYAYVSNNPINAVDPDGRETFVVTTFDYGVGSHSAILVARNGDNVLYDPAGSYVPESLNAGGDQRRSGDMFYGKDADLKSYVAYHKSTGSEVKVLKFNTTPQQEAQIKNRIEQRPGSTAPGSCTQAVCSVISGVGPFKNVKPTRWPGRLYERLKDLLTR